MASCRKWFNKAGFKKRSLGTRWPCVWVARVNQRTRCAYGDDFIIAVRGSGDFQTVMKQHNTSETEEIWPVLVFYWLPGQEVTCECFAVTGWLQADVPLSVLAVFLKEKKLPACCYNLHQDLFASRLEWERTSNVCSSGQKKKLMMGWELKEVSLT